MTIELRVPISPTPSFLNRVVLMAESIRRFHPDTMMSVYIGQTDGVTDEAAIRVQDAFRGRDIVPIWINTHSFDLWANSRSPYLGTMNARWHPQTEADHIIIADADVIFTGPLTELFAFDAALGVQAHIPALDNPTWQMLFDRFGVNCPPFDCEYSGAGIMTPEGTHGPWYPNSGMIFAPRAIFERMIDPYHEAIGLLNRVLASSYWFDQVGGAMAAAKAKVPVRSLPLRFNFPNQPEFDQRHPSELSDCRVLHYLRTTGGVDRDPDFSDIDAMRRLVARSDLSGSNELLRQHVVDLMWA